MIAQAALLAIGVSAVLVSCLGLLVLPQATDRLHLLGFASTVGAVAVVAADILAQGASITSVKAAITGALLLGLSPVLTHATGRAVSSSRLGDWGSPPGDDP